MPDLSPDQLAELAEAVAAHRQALAPLAGTEWRAGRTLGTTVYARTGGDDYKADTHIGEFRTPELAARAIGDHNAGVSIADLLWLLGAGYKVAIWPEDDGFVVELDGGVEWDSRDAGGPGLLAEGLAAARRWAEGEGITP